MADESGDKTESPTQRRRDEARRKGQVAYSQELTGSLLLLSGVLSIWLFGEYIAGNLSNAMKIFIENSYVTIERVSLQYVLKELVRYAVTIVGAFMAFSFVVALFANIAQVGFVISAEALEFNWEKLDPVSCLQKKVLSPAGLIRGLQQVLKISAIAAIAAWILWGRGEQFSNFQMMPLAESVGVTWGIAVQLLLATTTILLILAVGDFMFQKYRHEEQLKMSRQELKDEHKNEEGDPHVRARRRQLQRELAMKERMIQEIPKATVVITNPTHLAIALRYVPGEMSAPIVLAKGKGFQAKRIVKAARDHNVIVLERKPLAQALFKMVNIGDEIPPQLYYAVGEILAYLYLLKEQKAA